MSEVSKARTEQALRLVFRAKPNSAKWGAAKRTPGKFPLTMGTHHKPNVVRQKLGAKKRAEAKVWL